MLHLHAPDGLCREFTAEYLGDKPLDGRSEALNRPPLEPKVFAFGNEHANVDQVLDIFSGYLLCRVARYLRESDQRLVFDNIAQENAEGIFLEHFIVAVDELLVGHNQICGWLFLVNVEPAASEHHRK